MSVSYTAYHNFSPISAAQNSIQSECFRRFIARDRVMSPISLNYHCCHQDSIHQAIMSDSAQAQVGDYHHHGPEMLSVKHSPWASKPRQRAQLSCDRCRKLKRKCDRQFPCTECASFASPCSYERAQKTTEALHKSKERRKNARKSRSSRGDESFSTTMGDYSAADFNGSFSSHSPQDTKIKDNKYIPASSSSVFAHPGPRSSHDAQSSGASNPADISPWNATPPSAHTAETSPDTKMDSTPSVFSQTTVVSHPQEPLNVIEPAMKQDFDGLMRETSFVRRALSIWYRELEWMHCLLRGTAFDKVFVKNLDLINSEQHKEKFGGLLYSIIGLTTLIYPSDVEGCLVCMSSGSERHGFYSAASVRVAAFERTEKWLEDLTKRLPVTEWKAEAFQASIVHGMHIKYTGNWNLYREVGHRDMDRIQRAGYHNLSEMIAKDLDDDEIVARYSVFWRYFCLDRISSLFDGVPYTIQARNSDMWLFEEGAEPVHIRQLCRDSGAGYIPEGSISESPPVDRRLARRLEEVLTPYTLTMNRLAALAGRCGDRLNTMSQASLSDNYVRAEHIAAETDDDLFDIESKINMDQFSLGELPMVTLTIARIRRDITTRLSRHIAKLHKAAPQGEEAMVQTLNRRCLNTAKSLIRQGTSVLGGTPVRAIAMPFFSLFVAETMVELLTSVEQSISTSGNRVTLDSESKDDLKHALIGRNFLVLISRIGEVYLNTIVTQKACSHISAVLQRCLPGKHASIYKQIMDIKQVMDPEPIIMAISSPPQAIETGIAPQRAEDVLNFLGSLTSLQRIFEMGGQTWSQ